MFKVGQILKANLAKAEAEYVQWKGSQVYTNLMKAAETMRFEVTNETDSAYMIKRVSDGQTAPCSKAEAHSIFVVDDNGGDNK